MVMVHPWGTRVQESEAGAEAEAVEEHCLLACFSWLAQFVFLDIPGLPAQGWHYSHFDGPLITNHQSSINHQSKEWPTAYLRSYLTICEVISFQMTLACVKLT